MRSLLPHRAVAFTIRAVSLTLFAGAALASHAQTTPATVREIPLAWPGAKSAMPGMAIMDGMGSTHEIVWDRPNSAIWVTGQNYDGIARITTDGKTIYFALPKGSGPHGMALDGSGRLWVTLEFSGKVVRLDTGGKIAETIDVCLHASGATTPINPHPHGLAIGPDGKTLWFTGKKTGTIGRIAPDGTVTISTCRQSGPCRFISRQAPIARCGVRNLLATRLPVSHKTAR